MTYSDRPEPGTTPVSPRQAVCSAVIAAGLVVVLGLTFYGINAKYEGQTAAKPPAVLAIPAPATGVAPPAPQTTTGQSLPGSETTGQGEAR